MQVSKECKIAYIEDDNVVLEMVSLSLRRHYKDVYNARNGEDGIEMILQENPDIIITDLSMPVMGGLEMVQLLREEHGVDIPVIVTTAHDALDDMQGYFAAIIRKPINIKNLVTAIEALC